MYEYIQYIVLLKLTVPIIVLLKKALVMQEINGKFYAKSKTELSKVLGLTRTYIIDLCREKDSPKLTDDGYCTGAWNKWLMSKSKAQKKKDNPQNKANLEYRRECTKIKKLERKALEGILVNREDVMQEVMDILTSIRQTFMRLGRKVSAKIAMKPAAVVIVGIDAEVRRICGYFEELYKRNQITKKRGKAKVGKPSKIEKTNKKKV